MDYEGPRFIRAASRVALRVAFYAVVVFLILQVVVHDWGDRETTSMKAFIAVTFLFEATLMMMTWRYGMAPWKRAIQRISRKHGHRLPDNCPAKHGDDCPILEDLKKEIPGN